MTAETPPGPARDRASLPFPLQDGERVVQLCRRHWLYLWPNVFLKLIFAIAPPSVVAFLLATTDSYDGVAARLFWALAGLYLLYWAARIFLVWYRYHNDIWVITNQRLVDSFKPNPFSLRVATADLVNVQDMTVERRGLLQTVLDYGDIVCQTAAEQQVFRLSGIPHPRETQAVVDRERDRERRQLRDAGA